MKSGLLLTVMALACAVGLSGCGDGGPVQQGAPSPAVVSAERWPEADALFRRDPRWLGADAAFSIGLGPEKTLWLFGDTFVATSAANQRTESKMVRNTVAVMTGRDPSTAQLSFHWRSDSDGSPASFFPEDGEAWHWPMHGIRQGRLFVFLSRIKATPMRGLGFEAAGWRMVIIDNPDDPPEQWRRTVITPPDSDGLVLGQAVFHGLGDNAGHIMLLAQREPGDHQGFLARIGGSALANADLNQLEWWTGEGWSRARKDARPILDDAGPESSLTFEVEHLNWVHVRSDGFGASEVAYATAPTPEGPWSRHQRFFRPPESDRPHPFVYAAKLHPQLVSGAGDRIITYVSNTFDDFATLLADDSIYYPRFVRLRLSPRPTN